MNVDDVEVGALYEVPRELKRHHLATSGRGYDWDDRGPGRVLEKGLPYGEDGNVGVRIEFEMRPCSACDHG